VGYFFGAITLLYGIALGLLMVGDWSTLTDTQEKVDREASTLGAFYLDVCCIRSRIADTRKAICGGTPAK
jgi:hypothetical protein